MTLASSCPVSSFPGVFDPDYIAEPLPYLNELRMNSPVFHDAESDLWLVTRHADIRAILTDPLTFAPDNALEAITPIHAPALRILVRAGFTLPKTLANNGGPSHRAYRRSVAAFFSPARVAAMEPRIRSLMERAALRIESDLAAGGSANLISLLTSDLPAQVMLGMIGMPDDSLQELKTWSQAALELFWGNPSPDRQIELAHLCADLHSWLRTELRGAEQRPDSRLAALTRPSDDGEAIPEADAIAICFFLFVAGQETTSQLLTLVLWHLVGNQALWQRLALESPGERPALAARCVEEVLRVDSPVHTWRRVTTRPTTVGETTVPQGANLLLMLTASGSDPAVYADPEVLDPDRIDGAGHHAFGHGRHFCVGAGLARAEARIMVDVLAARLPALRLVDARPPMLGLLSFRAPTELHAVSR